MRDSIALSARLASPRREAGVPEPASVMKLMIDFVG